jgi:hypothetical protein
LFGAAPADRYESTAIASSPFIKAQTYEREATTKNFLFFQTLGQVFTFGGKI